MKKVLILLSAAAFLAACGGKKQAENAQEIKIDGSSTVYPLTEAVAEEYRAIAPDVRVTVGVSGTGGGFKKFGRKETDISDASRPIKAEEIAMCKESGVEFIELPVAYDGLAVVVSKDNDFIDHLTVAELKKIWEPEAQGKIKSWKQIRSTFPDLPINLYGAGVSSGTYDYFTEAICGKAKASRGDYTASEDDNVLVQGVSADKGGLAFFGLAYFEANKDKLKLVGVDNEKDEDGKGAILPSAETVRNGTYQPLARPEFIYVSKEAAQREDVKAFIKFYMENAPKLAAETGAVPLPAEVYTLCLERFNKGVTGSMFTDKSDVGVNMADLLKMEK